MIFALLIEVTNISSCIKSQNFSGSYRKYIIAHSHLSSVCQMADVEVVRAEGDWDWDWDCSKQGPWLLPFYGEVVENEHPLLLPQLSSVLPLSYHRSELITWIQGG